MEDRELWRKVFRECRPTLVEKLNGVECASALRLGDVLTVLEWEGLKKETSKDALIKLMDILPTKDRFWEHLKDYLRNSNQTSIIAKLEETYTRLEQLREEADSVEALNDPTLWRSAMHECQSLLRGNLNAVHCATELRLLDVISRSEWESVKKCNDSAEALVKFLEILMTKSCYWKPLLKYLKENNQTYIIEDLVKAYENPRLLAPDFLMPEPLCIAKLWNVPLRNPYFTGRNQLLEQLNSSLKPYPRPSPADITVISACHGLGGVGKTQLAIEFAHRQQADYTYIFWFMAEDTSLEAAYRTLAYDLKMDTLQPSNVIVRQLKSWFDRHPGCLLVYDNVTNPQAIKEYLPTTGTSHILVTSRTTQWDWLAKKKSFTVDVFTAEEARAYFQELLGDLFEPGAVNKLSKTLGYLPLALAQAGAFMKKNKVPPLRYLVLYRRDKKKLLANKTLPPDYPEPVFITWDITMQVIQKESKLAPTLLALCACLNSTDIPYFLLDEWAKQEVNNPNEEFWEEALGTLGDYSMLTINPESESVAIHCLVQEVIQLKWTAEETKVNFPRAIACASICFPCQGESQKVYNKIQRLLPHFEVLQRSFDKWSASSDKDLTRFFLDTIHICLERGYHIFQISTKQRDLQRRALVIKEKHYGPDHPGVAITLNNLGTAYGELGEYTKQRELLERALIIRKKHYGLDHPEVAATLNNLGNACGHLGEYAKKRELLERALVIVEKHYDPNHPQVAATLNNLGNAYGSLGEYEKQRELLERALLIKEKHYGSDNPEVARTLGNLGNAYGCLGQYAKQRGLLERALPIEEKHYGPDHPDVGRTLTNLGNAYGLLGEYTKQRELLERALIIRKKHYGPDHPEVATILSSLGLAYESLGEYTKQRELLERALVIEEKYHGPNHPEVARTLCNLGKAYAFLGEYMKAQELLERAVVIKEKYHGPNHPKVARTLVNLGNVDVLLGQYAKGRELMKRALPIFEKNYGPEHPEAIRLKLFLTLSKFKRMLNQPHEGVADNMNQLLTLTGKIKKQMQQINSKVDSDGSKAASCTRYLPEGMDKLPTLADAMEKLLQWQQGLADEMKGQLTLDDETGNPQQQTPLPYDPQLMAQAIAYVYNHLQRKAS